jgi:hypothetical protein
VSIPKISSFCPKAFIKKIINKTNDKDFFIFQINESEIKNIATQLKKQKGLHYLKALLKQILNFNN